MKTKRRIKIHKEKLTATAAQIRILFTLKQKLKLHFSCYDSVRNKVLLSSLQACTCSKLAKFKLLDREEKEAIVPLVAILMMSM